MTQIFKNTMREVMTLAWQFVRRNGYNMSEALKVAWRNIKLHAKMKSQIVRFRYQKMDGTIREAFGTLVGSITPATKGSNRKQNPTVQAYYDTESQGWRSYKKANLVYVG